MQGNTPLAPQPVSTILIVEDHPIVCEGLKAFLAYQSDLRVVGAATDLGPALELLRAEPVDVALIDLSLKISDGFDLIKIIRQRWPATRMLVLSGYAESLHAERSLRAGAHGYLNKTEIPRKIVAAIRHVLAGKIYLSETMTEQILQASLQGTANPRVSRTVLSDRELKIFQLIGRGMTTAAIAQELQIGTKTVETYRARIKGKLNLHSGVELIHEAVRSAHEMDSSGQVLSMGE